MNEKIQHIIQEIRSKKQALDGLLLQEKQRVSQFEQEILQLKSDLIAKDAIINQLEMEKSDLLSLVEETKMQVVQEVQPLEIGYEHIDDMVREIEYCIGQLKNNA